MRLVIATPFLETRGGMERVILMIARHFGARVHCIGYDPANTFSEFEKLDVEVARPSPIRKMPFSRRVTTAIEAGSYFYNLKLEDYDLINAQQTPSEWIRHRNSPVVWYCHTPNREAFDLYEWRMKQRNLPSKAVFWASIQAFKFLEHRTVPQIEYIFTNSMNSQSRLKKYLGRESEVLHPGVDADRFFCRGYENFFFYPSRIAPEKRLEYAIDAFNLFSKQAKGWKLVLAGSLSERPEHQGYFKKIKSMCGDSVSIETNISENRLLDLYSRCYAVLYTPINEDYGLVPLEAMAASKPCLAPDEGGPRETIVHGTDGFLVSGPEQMAGRMEWLAKRPEKCEAMGKAGRAKVVKEFTWRNFLKRFEEKTEEIVDAHPRRD